MIFFSSGVIGRTSVVTPDRAALTLMTATSFPKTFFDGTGTAVLRAAPVPAYPQATDSEQESLTEIKDVGQGEITEEFHLAKREDAATAPLKGRRPGLFSI
jgi:hypothetical protein